MLFRLFSKSTVSIISLCFLIFVAWPLSAHAAHPKILIYGDSLSAAYGIPQESGWAHLLQQKLRQEYMDYEVINASISGETTSGGLARLQATLAQTRPEIIILELGANDGLRGLPIRDMHDNLNAMIQLSKQFRVKILLIGMRVPPNYGAKYTEAFHQTYPSLANKHKIKMVPFMLDQVAANPKLIQQDGLHPNALGQPIILNHIWQQLRLLIKPGKRQPQ